MNVADSKWRPKKKYAAHVKFVSFKQQDRNNLLINAEIARLYGKAGVVRVVVVQIQTQLVHQHFQP